MTPTAQRTPRNTAARHGTILLANLDVDVRVPGGAQRTAPLDGLDDKIVDSALDREALPIQLDAPPAGRLVLRIAPADAPRVRFFAPDGAGGFERVLGAAQRPALPTSEYTANAANAANGRTVDLLVEAVTLPGPGNGDGRVWLELTGDGGGWIGTYPFTIAPLLLLSNLRPARRVYATYARGTGPKGNHGTITDLILALRKIYGPNEVPVRRRTGSIEYVPHDAAGPTRIGKLHLINGRTVSDDQWVQDEFEIGYCHAPSGWLHVVLHNPRGGPLGDWVARRLPEADIALYGDLAVQTPDRTDAGGNLELSAPVPGTTPELRAGPAGPAVSEQQAAPFGKILLGEGRIPLFTLAGEHAPALDIGGAVPPWLANAFAAVPVALDPGAGVTVVRAGEEWRVDDPSSGHAVRLPRVFEICAEDGRLTVYYLRPLTDAYRDFLRAQRIQPVLPLDTSWLHTGHVDELVSLVPEGRDGDFRMLVASPALAVALLEKARAYRDRDPETRLLTAMFRGRSWLDNESGGLDLPAALTVDEALARHGFSNLELQDLRLTPIEQRLTAGLGLDDGGIVRLPVLFNSTGDLPDALLGVVTGGGTRIRTTALTPNLVNMLVLDRHVLVPRPMGPRMRSNDVAAVLGDMGVPARMPAELTRQYFWARDTTTVDFLAGAFGVPAQTILNEPENRPGGVGVFDRAPRDEWARVRIPGDDVDLFEAYAWNVLTGLGLTVHFIDDWDAYHAWEGEVHCATNTMREPAEAEAGYLGPYWWEEPGR